MTPTYIRLINDHRRFRHRLAATLVALTISVSSVGCSNGRSVEAFCGMIKSEKQRILSQFSEAKSAVDASPDDFSKAIIGLGAGFQAMGELEVYFKKLNKVAPEEISAETEILAESIGELTDVPELSVTGIAGKFFDGLKLNGPLTTVGNYAQQNCGENI